MERRRDFRLELQVPLQVRCERTQRVLDGIHTENVSASGLVFRPQESPGLACGDRVRVELLAVTKLPRPQDSMVLLGDARVVRAEARTVAVAFERPLAVGG